jgi:hypothetical protein
VLYPAGLGKVLGELLLGGGTDVTVVVENDGAGGTGSLVQRQNVFFHQKVVISSKDKYNKNPAEVLYL